MIAKEIIQINEILYSILNHIENLFCYIIGAKLSFIFNFRRKTRKISIHLADGVPQTEVLSSCHQEG